GPLQDPIHVGGGTSLDIKTSYTIGHQATAIADVYRKGVDRRQFVAGRELTHSGAVNNEYSLARNDETIGTLPDSSVERSRQVIRRLNVVDQQRNAQRWGRLLHCLHRQRRNRI